MDENNAYFLCILPIHPLANSILGQEDDLSGAKEGGIDNLLI